MDGEQEKCALIVPRRNFLIRALGFTAVGASVPVPVLALDTAEMRLNHHIEGAHKALQELYPSLKVTVQRDWMMSGFKTPGPPRLSFPEEGGFPLLFMVQDPVACKRAEECEREVKKIRARYGV